MTNTKITSAGVIRESWNRAYLAAVLAVEPVRQHISAAMRSAWADFRKARAEGIVPEEMTQVFEDQHARAGRAEARIYLKGLLAAKAEAALVQVGVADIDDIDAVPELVDEAPEEDQLSLLEWIVADAIQAGEPGVYAVDQVEPVAPMPEMAPARQVPVEPKPIQLCIIDLIAADVAKADEPEVVGIPETVSADQDDEDALDEVVSEQVVDPRQELLARIARNDAAMERIEQKVRRDVEIYGMSGGSTTCTTSSTACIPTV